MDVPLLRAEEQPRQQPQSVVDISSLDTTTFIADGWPSIGGAESVASQRPSSDSTAGSGDDPAMPPREVALTLMSTPAFATTTSTLALDNHLQPSLSSASTQYGVDGSVAAGSGKQETDQLAVQAPEDGKQRREVPAHWFFGWTLEISSSLLSIVCFGAIVFTLGNFDNVPRSHWTFFLPINSLVAVFTALMKTALIMPVSESISQVKWLRFESKSRSLEDIVRYDRASRGPFGCVKFLSGQIRRKDGSYFASLGAVITIASLALEPFSQAVVGLYTCHYPLAEAARIPWMSTYTRSGWNVQENGWGLDMPAQAALYVGLVDPPKNSSSPIEAECSTGNCTFTAAADGTVFSTISMCHKCGNISSEIRTLGDDEWRLYGSYTNTVGMDMAMPLLTCEVKEPKDSSAPWFEFECLMLNNNKDATSNVSHVPYAVGCTLDPCVKNFTASVNGSRYVEKELSRRLMVRKTVDSRKVSGSSTFEFYWMARSTLIGGVWTACDPKSERTDTHTEYWEDLDEDSKLGLKNMIGWYPKGCIYGAGYKSLRAMNRFLTNSFDHHNISSEKGGATQMLADGDLWLQRAYNFGNATMSNFDDMAEGLAFSITALMRQPTERQHRSFVEGQTFREDTCIGITWRWLSFPACLLLLELFLLAVTVDRGRRARWRGDWKSSPLPLLFNGPVHDGEIIGAARESSVGGMYDKARPMRFQLVVDDGSRGGWRLSRIE